MISEQVQIEMYEFPYKFFLFNNFFDPEEFDEVVTQLQEFDAWNLHIGHFFEQWEYKFPSSSDYPVLDKLFEHGQTIRQLLEEAYDVPLSARFDIVAHKLCAGQKILVHTDNPRFGYETHRFVINANPNYQDTDGGHLFICSERDPVKIYKALRPVSNTGFSFEASTNSLHAVGRVLQSDRYSIIFSFWHLGNTRSVQKKVNEALAGARQHYQAEIEPGKMAPGSPQPAPVPGEETRMETYCLLRAWGVDEAYAKNNYLLGADSLPSISLGLGKTHDGEEEAARCPVTFFARMVAEAPRFHFCVSRWNQGRQLYLRHGSVLPPAALPLLDHMYRSVEPEAAQ
jgi:hypothetical protein